MYDTLMALNELWLQQGAALVISKIYASVDAMEADTNPVSDISGKPLRPGQIVVIASEDEDNGSVYRYNGTDSPSWSLVGKIGNLEPVDSLDSDSTQLPLAAHQGKVLDGKINQLGQKVDKTLIPIVYIGGSSTPYAPNWQIGDIMYSVTQKKLRKCKTVIPVTGGYDVGTFEDYDMLPNTILVCNNVMYEIDANAHYGIRAITNVIEVKDVSISIHNIEIGEFVLKTNSNRLELKIGSEVSIDMACLDSTLFLYDDKLYRILDNEVKLIADSGGDGGIFTSTYVSQPATLEIPLNTINIADRTIKIHDFIIANPSYSYVYEVTAVNENSVSVAYYSTLKGQTGATGATGSQGNSGYSGAAGELKVVNNLEDGGEDAALSAEQGKILGNWKNYNSEDIILRPKTPKPIQNIDLSNWQADSKGSVGSSTQKIYDEILQDYVEVRPLTSTNNTSSYDGARFTKQLSQAVDMTTNVLRGAIYQDIDYTPSDVDKMNVSLYSDGQIDANHRMYCTLSARSNDANYNRTGWFHFCLNIPLMGYYGGTLFDITNVTHIGFNINHAAGTTINLAVTEFDILPCLTKPGILTVVDNFNPNVPAMAEYAASKGVRLNLSIIPNWIDNGDVNSGTLQEVYDAAKQGHYIINHTWNHQIYGGQSALEVFEQINKADRWMIERGLCRGSKVLSNPSAAFDNSKYKAYFASQAAMVFHHWCPFFVPSVRPSSDVGAGDTKCILYYPYKGMNRLLNISLLDSSFASDFSKLVPSALLGANAAIDFGGILVCGFHGYGTTYGGYMPDDTIWKAYIDAISELDIHHYTIDELLEGAFI